MKPSIVFLVTFSVVAASHAYWSQEDTDRLASVFQTSLAKQDLAGRHFAASGLKLLKVASSASAAKSACEIAKTADLKDISALYHAASLAGDLSGCALNTQGVKETIDAVAKNAAATAETLYYALSAAERLSIKIDKAAFDTALTAAAKNTAPNNLAYVANAAALLEKAQAAKYKNSIASLVKQSDLVDKKFRQYEDGLVVTANAVHGILSWIELVGNAADLTPQQLTQFSAYLLSLKHISTEAGAFHFLKALGVLVNNQHRVPVALEIVGGNTVDLGKSVKVHVSNVFGLPITVSAVKATVAGAPVALTKADSTGLLFDLPLEKITTAGFYPITFSIETQDKRLIAPSESVKIKVVQEISVENFKVGIVEKDGTPSGSNLNSVNAFSKLGKVLESNHHNKIYASMTLKSKKDGKLVKAHQVFAVFTHSSGAETIFTLDNQGNGVYVLDVNLVKGYKDFDGVSGKYSASIVVGDALIKTPVNYVFADFSLTLPSVPVPEVPKSEQVYFEPRKEITHIFREPDERPPAFISDVFTLVCLAPLGILIILWFAIGINFGNMPLSPFVLVFHVGLAAIFGLYFLFWLQIDMFETLKYLGVIGGITLLAGNRLLRSLAEKRKLKSE